MIYFQREQNEYESYTEYIAVPENLISIFLYLDRDSDWELCDRGDIDDNEEDIEVFEMPSVERVSIKQSDISADLKERYKGFIQDWAKSGQDPRNWGMSVGMIWGNVDTKPYEEKYPVDNYVDDEFEKELDRRKSKNQHAEEIENIKSKLLNKGR